MRHRCKIKRHWYWGIVTWCFSGLDHFIPSAKIPTVLSIRLLLLLFFPSYTSLLCIQLLQILNLIISTAFLIWWLIQTHIIACTDNSVFKSKASHKRNHQISFPSILKLCLCLFFLFQLDVYKI